MVTEWEKEELGRLTLRNLKSVPQEPQEHGRMTHQNLQSLKTANKKTDTNEVKVKLFFERLRLAVTTGLTSLFAPRTERKGEDLCAAYGHNWPFGQTWEGTYPKCIDCGKSITDASQLRSAVPISERGRHAANPDYK